METKTLSPKMLRQRKFLLGLPVLIVPFMTLLFWSLGGGKGSQAKAETAKGFNSKLPDAILNSKVAADKMSFYAQAKLDSQKRMQQIQSDPYAKKQMDSSSVTPRVASFTSNKFETLSPNKTQNDPAANEAKIYQQLAALQAAMNHPATAPTPVTATTNNSKSVAMPKPTEDPELKQMNGLLEKVLDIQHPNRVKEKTETNTPEKRFQAIPAVVEGNQKVVTGTVVKLRLLDTATINGQPIPKGALLYGAGNLYNQRLTITIKNIGLNNIILPVDLTVFDKNDALEGISVPEAVTGDGLKDGADQGVQSMELMSLDGSMAAQAATAGLNTAKGLFSKKIKRVKGKIKGGHLVLLRDNKKK